MSGLGARAARVAAVAGTGVAAAKMYQTARSKMSGGLGRIPDHIQSYEDFVEYIESNRFSGPLPREVCAGRFHEHLPQPINPQYKIALIGFTCPGGWEFNTDKCKDGVRYDSIPIANAVIKTGNACHLLNYDWKKHREFREQVKDYDAFIVRVNPGQIDNAQRGAQLMFDNLMNDLARSGKPVWSSPDVQSSMGAKDALVKIKDLSCGLVDTQAYYTAEELEVGFKKTCAFQPRVIKQNRGSAGEGIWLCWLQGKPYCKKYGEAMLSDDDQLKLMEMNDNHVEYHTVKEFLEFCVHGPSTFSGTWDSVFPGQYLAGGKDAGGQLVDQRLLPRIVEGEVRMLMVKDTLFMIVHKIPDGGMSAVGGIAKYKFYEPGAPEFADLENKFLKEDMGKLKKALGIEEQPLPLLWTADFIPKDAEDGTPGKTEYVVGEFNCSCVGISQFGAACGPDKGLADVSDANFKEASRLTDLMGRKAIEILEEIHMKSAE
eukprot:gnl/MRDRNA2_/MRDRNA2_142083_c0_seq1.p1 gnl/MRDRNA2_/MRDRNA2_142083_c0~~gnl/MRDRNA2_/MRDRNA2_142083_c0_seq1.p1  ORF type:complete len:487 (-),score=113.87 gnl/MRDRNA2_/MRDRNA2_142083_c0_seq1:10-1470(-)